MKVRESSVCLVTIDMIDNNESLRTRVLGTKKGPSDKLMDIEVDPPLSNVEDYTKVSIAAVRPLEPSNTTEA